MDIILKIEIKIPAIARPRGRLKMPMKDNNRPRNQRIKFTPGNQLNKTPIKATRKPAVPIPFVLFSIWLTIT